MLVSSLIISYFVFGSVCGKNNILSEVLFMQSYFNGCYLHTWSLAVEEHFYIFLSLVVYLMIKFRLLNRRKISIFIFASLIFIVFMLRYSYIMSGESIEKLRFFMSHLRCDGLLMGVLTSYIYNFYPEIISGLKRFSAILLIVTTGLISIIFYTNTKSFFLLTYGFDLIALGFSLVLVLNLIYKENNTYIKIFNHPLAKLFALIGKYSYSIYLWHIIVAQLLNHYLQDQVTVLLYFVSAIIVGMLFSIAIEQPFMKMREKIPLIAERKK